MTHLTLRAVDFQDAKRWRWTLSDRDGLFLGDHQVNLGESEECFALLNLYEHLTDACSPDRRIEDETRILQRLGKWAGEVLLGPLAMRIVAETPTLVRVAIPQPTGTNGGIESIVYLPLELAYASGKPLALQDVSFVYEVEGDNRRADLKPVGKRLRFLAVFSLPQGESALNLRRERYELHRLLHSIAATKGLAIDVRVLQYGVTRETLERVLEEGEGWDIVHFSGHGAAGALAFETSAGLPCWLRSSDLVDLLKRARERLKCVTLSACSSAAVPVAETLRWLGLASRQSLAGRRETARFGKDATLSALARAVVRELDCAVLAMRFPVGDDFAIQLGEHIYRGVLEQGNSLDRALQISLARIAKGLHSPLAIVTPTLFGARAAGLFVTAPIGKPEPSTRIGMAHFPPVGEHFVGRVATLAMAGEALSPDSRHDVVVFHGMAGGGKTACALELAFHYEQLGRFTDFVWYRAPEKGHDISQSLSAFVLQWELQVRSASDQARLSLSELLANPGRFTSHLPRLKQFLRDNSVLLVLDNLESLLLANGTFRDDLWARVLDALSGHGGLSRVILTSRIEPVFSDTSRVLVCLVHALPLDEAALLVRQLKNLDALARNPDQRHLLLKILEIVQGHPKLIEFAEAMAGNLSRLSLHLKHAAQAETAGDLPLRAFFESGESALDAEQFMTVLKDWATLVSESISPNARELFMFLCCLEEQDREASVVSRAWPRVYALQHEDAEPPAWEPLVMELVSSALIKENPPNVYDIHPGVADAGRLLTSSEVQAKFNKMMGTFWGADLSCAQDKGLGNQVIRAALSAAPYLARCGNWVAVALVFDRALLRDRSPSTLGRILPLLERSVNALVGTADFLMVRGIYGRALRYVGRAQETESTFREVIREAIRLGHFRLARCAADDLVHLLRDTGRYTEALTLVEQKAGYTAAAGLGPHEVLMDEGHRLQILAFLGRRDEVLERVEQLRQSMLDLCHSADDRLARAGRDVTRFILSDGAHAALFLERWETAIALNAEVISLSENEMSPFEMARIRANDAGPLIRLGRFAEARNLLRDCRTTFESCHAVAEIGPIFSSLADLEYHAGNTATSVDHARTALRYSYVAGATSRCRDGHWNLAEYLRRVKGPPEEILGHRLAASLIELLTCGGMNNHTVKMLASDLINVTTASVPPRLLDFDDICSLVEGVEGVHFRDLFERLGKEKPTTGEQALQFVFLTVMNFVASKSGPDSSEKP